jgi:ParB family chromosome partitioning protein
MQTHPTHVPLSQLRIDPTANVRQTERKASAAWMNSIAQKGIIEPLIVRPNGKGYLVTDGGERLVNLQALNAQKRIPDDYQVRIEVREESDVDARDTSLIANTVRKDMHPIEQHRAFVAQIKDGRTEEDLAAIYTLTPRQVKQSLALGALAVEIQDAWLAGKIRGDVAKAFTLAPDQKAQVKLFNEMKAEFEKEEFDASDIDADSVREQLKVNENDAGKLVHFVGIDAYIKRGGKVTQDLFGTDHTVSDAKLAKAMANEKLDAECKRLLGDGWSFAVTKEKVGNKRYSYSGIKAVASKPTEEEGQRLAELEQVFRLDLLYPTFDDMDDAQQQAYVAHRQLKFEIELRGFTPAMRAKSGCFVDVDYRGLLKIELGKVKPTERKAAESTARTEKTKAAAKNLADGKAAPEPKELSQALRERLLAAQSQATLDAIVQIKAPTAFLQLAQQLLAQQILPSRHWHMPEVIRNALPKIREALGGGLVNPAIERRFDANDYFTNAPKGFVVKAIAEAISPQEAAKAIKRPKAEFVKLAIHNIPKTGWVPKEMRGPQYAGPGSANYRPPAVKAAAAPAKSSAPAKPAATKKKAAKKKKK